MAAVRVDEPRRERRDARVRVEVGGHPLNAQSSLVVSSLRTKT